jgi:hypothetical protein
MGLVAVGVDRAAHRLAVHRDGDRPGSLGSGSVGPGSVGPAGLGCRCGLFG